MKPNIANSEALQRFIFDSMSVFEEDTQLNTCISYLNSSILNIAKVRAEEYGEALKGILDETNVFLCYVVEELESIENEFHDDVKTVCENKRKAAEERYAK